MGAFVRDVRRLYGEPVATFLHRRALGRLAVVARGTVLDVGCDGMPWKAGWAARVDRWIGLDLPVYRGEPTPADVHADAQCLPIRAQSIDVVLCTRMLDNVEEPEALFREAFRVLKRPGILVLSAHQYGPVYNVPRNYWRFTRHGLELLARRAGFTSVRLELLGGTCALLASVVQFHLPALLGRHRATRAIAAVAEAGLLRLDARIVREGDCLGWIIVCDKT